MPLFSADRLRFFPPASAVQVKVEAPGVVERKGLTFSPGFVPLDAYGRTIDRRPESLGWYRAAWLAYACMSYRATKMAEPALWIREESDGGEAWLTGDHPLAVLLKRPNPDQRMRAFLQRVSLYLDGTGRCVVVKVRDRGNRAAALRAFHAEDVAKIEAADGRLFGRFQIRTAAGLQWFGAEDVIHLHEEDPNDPYGVVAPLHAALSRLGIDADLVDAIKSGIRNSIVPGMTLVFPEGATLTDGQKEEFKASLSEGYEGARRHGKALVLGGGVTPHTHDLGFGGLEAGELGKELEAAICAVFQIPPVVLGAYVGLENSGDRHNMETSRQLFYENAVEPRWTQIEEALTDDLLSEVDSNPLRFVRFVRSQVKALQTDQRMQAQISEKTRDVLTINERRVMLGYEPLKGADGDRISASPAPPAPQAEDEKGAGARMESKAGDDTRWTLFDAVTRSQEFGWTLAASAQLEADRDAILTAARQTLRTAQKDDDPFAPADSESVRELIRYVADSLDLARGWRDRTRPVIEATARQAAERISVELGLSFDLLTPGLLEYVETHAAELVTQVTGTTKQAIRDALREGLEAGEGIPALTKRIQESTAFSRQRAELIAQTETTSVSNGAQRASLSAYTQEHGGRATKTWLSARDARVRDAHRAMNGKTLGIDEEFDVPGEGRTLHPNAPRCRCTLTYALED